MLKSVGEDRSFPPLGLVPSDFPHGLRRGLHSYAASRLRRGALFSRVGEILLLVSRSHWSAGSRTFCFSGAHFRVRLRLGERDARQWRLRQLPRPPA